MANAITIGIGAGLTAALLFAATATMSPFALILSYISPLPVVIAGMGWTHLTGLLAVAVGGAVLSAVLGPAYAIGFTFGVAAPAWLMCWLAITRLGPERREVPSNGTILLGIALIAGGMTLASALAVGGGSFTAYGSTMRQLVEAILRMQTGTPQDQPLVLGQGIEPAEAIDILVGFFPVVIGASIVPLLVGNLWGGAKAVAVSGRLQRPWVPLPSTQMPRAALGIFAAAMLLAAAGGYPGILGKGIVGAGICALAFQALAAIHDRTRGKPGRPFFLGLIYLIMTITAGWPIPFLAIYGLIDLFTRRPEAVSNPD